MKMIFKICLTTSFLLAISSALAMKEVDKDAKVRKRRSRGAECGNAIECPTFQHKSTQKCQDHRDCRKKEVCHDLLKICYVKKRENSRMKLKETNKKTKTPTGCKVDGDCRQNQTCHTFFATCVDKSRVQTTMATKTNAASVRICKENSDCSEGHYCHAFFKMCLPELKSYLETTSSSTLLGCKSASDCGTREFCHNLTSICLPLPTAAKTSATPKSSRACILHAHCKTTEFCHYLMQRHDPKNGAQNKEVQSAIGVCTARTSKQVPKDENQVSQNCSQSTDCGAQKCCLSGIGLCADNRMIGELCFEQRVPFSCPCLPGLKCVSRRRPMRLKRLEKKIKLLKEAMKRQGLQLNKTTEFKVGKCLKIPN